MTFFFEILHLGFGNLRRHALRSLLTSLGIIIGVAAVILMVAIGEGNKQAALREINALGATNIIVRSQKPPEAANMGSEERSFVVKYGITFADLRRLENAGLDAVHIVPLKQIGSEVLYRAKRTISQCFGTTPELLAVAKLHVARGRYLTYQDMEQRLKVCVIGDEVAKQFFKLTDPLGEKLRIDDRIFTIVGILRPVGLAGGAGSALVGRDLNKDVHLPLSTAKLEFGDTVIRRQSGNFSGEEVELQEIYLTAPSTEAVVPTAARVQRLIDWGHSRQADVELIVPWELLENARRTQLIWDLVLTFIAALSLLVGGIGVMNIMLASVTERTREIGIRRALGATRRHILAQFLVETGSLSAVGGLVGIGLGIGFSTIVGTVLPIIIKWMVQQGMLDANIPTETQVTMWSIVVSFMVAVTVGLVFGIYPAVVASRQDPIVALRHD